MTELHAAASAALDRLPALGSEQALALLDDCVHPEMGPLLTHSWREHKEALDAFVSCARAVLGVTD